MAKNALKTALTTIGRLRSGDVRGVVHHQFEPRGRERRKQQTIREFDRKNAKESPNLETGVASSANRAKQASGN